MGKRIFIMSEPNCDWYWTGHGFSTDRADAKAIEETLVQCLLAYYGQAELRSFHFVTEAV